MTLCRLNGILAAAAAALCQFAAGFASAQEYLPWGGQHAANDAYQPGANSYGNGDTYRPQVQGGGNDSYQPGSNGYGNGNAYQPGTSNGNNNTYQPNGSSNAYQPNGGGRVDDYPPEGQDNGYSAYGNGNNGNGTYSNTPPSDPGYGEPYSPAPQGPPPDGQGYNGQASGGGYEKGEIITAGHQFFGSISQGLASAVEYAFQSQGRPNGYILGQDAGGAFVLGLRYGEGTLYTKDAGSHKVFWQGPSVGYDAGAEGSKTMVLVYNLHDPSDIYNRFGGVQGSAYIIGGISLQFQKYGDVTLGVIRSGVGLRLGANVGYLKYTRTPTWNPL